MDFIGRKISAEEQTLADKLQSDIRKKIQREMKQIKEKIEALRAAQEHQIEMLEKDIPSSIEYIE